MCLGAMDNRISAGRGSSGVHTRERQFSSGHTGAGLGASHQTGWTGLVALLLDVFGRVDAKTLLETERGRTEARLVRAQVGGDQNGE